MTSSKYLYVDSENSSEKLSVKQHMSIEEARDLSAKLLFACNAIHYKDNIIGNKNIAKH
jgi:hypothetical protein